MVHQNSLQSSLQNQQNQHNRRSTLLIVPEVAISPSQATGDSIQSPSEPPLYVKLAEEGSGDWRASGILHDFNNQLAIILSHCSIALRKLPADSNARSNLERAVRATKRAADLSAQLQIGMAVEEEDLAALDLNQLLQETVAVMEPLFGANVQLITNYAPTLPAITASPVLIYRTLLNILLNAFDALEDATGEIQITTAAVALPEWQQQEQVQQIPPGHYVLVEICDSGAGMDQATLDQIFMPYFSTKTPGLGLGLTAAQHIMQFHQGIIHFQSQPANGTIVQLFFPT